MRKITYFLIVFLVSINGFANETFRFLKHKEIQPLHLTSIPLSKIDSQIESAAKKECLVNLMEKIADGKTKKLKIPDGWANDKEYVEFATRELKNSRSYAEIVFESISAPDNIAQQFIVLDDREGMHGFSSIVYDLKSFDGASKEDDQNLQYKVLAYVGYQVKEFNNDTSEKNVYQMNCWLENRPMMNNVMFTNRKINLVTTEFGTYAGEDDFENYSSTLDDTNVNADIFYSAKAANLFVYKGNQLISDKVAIGGYREVYFMKIPESIWIHDGFENQYVPVDIGYNSAAAKVDTTHDHFSPQNFQVKPFAYQGGIENSEFKYDFYF